jgi:hypothetical protein
MPSGAQADLPRAQYEQMRERMVTQGHAGWESDLLKKEGLRSWIEAGRQMSGPRQPSAERQKTDAHWKPIIPMVASLLVRLAERNTHVPQHA